MKARVAITLKNGVLDPQGKAIHNALTTYGFDHIRDVRQGKIIDLALDETDPEKVKIDVTNMCEKLLVNMVIENYTILSVE